LHTMSMMLVKCTSGAMAWILSGVLRRAKPVSGVLAFFSRSRKPAPPAAKAGKRRRDARGRFVSNRPTSGGQSGRRVATRDAERRWAARPRNAEERNRDPFAPGRLLERRTDPRLSHDFAQGDRVWHPSHGEGWVMGIPTPILPHWPETVTVRWDRHGASFDRCCNDHPRRDHVAPESLTMVKIFTPRAD